MQFGEQIHGLRKRRGLSQERFAQELHVTRQAVSNWENNKNLPDLETLIAMSGTFDVSLDELILGEDMRTMKTNDLVAGGNSTIGPEAGGQTAREGMGGAAACPDTDAPAMTDIARKLINDSSETRRAHDNKVTTLIGTFLLVMGFFCFFARTNSVEYVDAQGFLHESFWLVPTGYLFLLAGAVVFACVGARTIRAAIAKKKDE
ncbi:MAG: DUF3955 domain-containing protein [Olegusella sp.]|nr:DUF3955 domain-containing protein [Olegusella sp.]